ncbi:hypothetical protein Maes01_01718 [Microbulbifer aestuariivivens]|uniref:DUF4136 domain-containing protein n=1 Tax=Microbulbifer aestuariivivens TaxID=1908308 RepID=A0ABP9WPL9_9GAMM
MVSRFTAARLSPAERLSPAARFTPAATTACRWSARAALIAACLWLFGCAAVPQVAVDYDPQADFSRLQTYYLLDPLATGPVAPLELKRARQAVEQQLQYRYRPADSAAAADFLVRVQLQGSERVAVYEDRFSLYGGHGPWGFGWQVPLNVRQYRQVHLVIDALSAQKAPLWRGSVRSAAMGARSPQEQQQRLASEAALILSRFPPY